jgi:hypothetical protein
MLKAADIELIHNTFLRQVLCVKRSTNLTALYGELGRFPLHLNRQIIMINYSRKMLKQNDSSLIKKTYLFLKSETDRGYTYRNNNWASHIKTLLTQIGQMYIWNEQFEIDVPFNTMKQRLFNIYLQSWYSDVNNTSRLKYYCTFKHKFELENYLSVITENKYRIAMKISMNLEACCFNDIKTLCLKMKF